MLGGIDAFRTEIKDKIKEGFVSIRNSIRKDVSRLLSLSLNPQNRLTPESNGLTLCNASGSGGDLNFPYLSDTESDLS